MKEEEKAPAENLTVTSPRHVQHNQRKISNAEQPKYITARGLTNGTIFVYRIDILHIKHKAASRRQCLIIYTNDLAYV
ncbi:hypothetical protein VSX61_12120 [Brenneria populi subsp. brevivirga]|uniref:hypothetical protein n=1 Tax=Brenneria populi TaxID=1505588 RepID=UPI002E17BB7F|nr:hypothetical protein [Brenneria populi subsp. brevivirga]